MCKSRERGYLMPPAFGEVEALPLGDHSLAKEVCRGVSVAVLVDVEYGGPCRAAQHQGGR